MVLQDGVPHLILEGLARPWSLRGYSAPVAPLDCARLITPPSTVATLRAGYRPRIHASAFGEWDANAVWVCDFGRKRRPGLEVSADHPRSG
jgi:hypothetical protein